MQNGRVAERTSSRLRRTNDRSVLGVHEDHENDENAEIGVQLHAQNLSFREFSWHRFPHTIIAEKIRWCFI